MSTPFRIKRSAIPGKKPVVADLQLGELALNTYDGYLFSQRDTGGVGIGTTVSLLTPWIENYGGQSIYYNQSVGIGTTNATSKLTVVGDVYISGISTLGIITATNLTAQSLVISGISTLGITSATNLTSQSLVVSGISTFTNGPVLVGTATSTGTASQRLQVTGGAYVSGNLGIGTTNPTSKLHVVGDARVTGVVTATTFVGALTGTATSTTNIPNLTGDVTSNGTTTAIAAGVIVNADINASAGIVDTKLATISTALKVSNSATTATNANTNNAIVARDASGNFSAGTITANLTGTATSTTNIPNLTGAITSNNTTTSLGSFSSSDLATALTDETGSGSAVFATSPTLTTVTVSSGGINVTGVSTVSTGTTAIPSLSFLGSPGTGLYSPGSNQFGISANGSARITVDASGNTTISGASTVVVATNGVERINIEADGDINIDGGGVFYDATNNRLAIGTTSPGGPLGVQVDTGKDVTVGLTSGSPMITYRNGSGAWFHVGKHPTSDALIFSNGATTTTSEMARFDNGGRLLVGTSTSRTLAGNTGQLQLEGTNYQVASITTNTNSTSGAYVLLGKSRGTSLGSKTVVQNGDTLGGLFFTGADGTNDVYSASIQAQVDGAPGANKMPGRLVFSTATDASPSVMTERLRITSTGQVRLASAGITFNGDTATANELDDYEEGTFTPTIIGAITAGTGTYSVNVGRYTKIGNMVYFTCRLIWSAHTGTGTMRVTGLPFTSNSTANSHSPVTVRVNNLTSPASTKVQAHVNVNSTNVVFESIAVGGGVATGLAIDTAADVILAGHYSI